MADLKPAPPVAGANWSALEDYLRAQDGLVPEPCRTASMKIHQFTGGHANLTYQVRFGDHHLVVRRAPPGNLPRGANDMSREYRVLDALWPVYPPAPRTLTFCDDASVIGAPFLVVEFRAGNIVRDTIPAPMQHHGDVARRVSLALVDAIAALHSVDYEAVGLASLGRPDGFVARQLQGWQQRWDAVSDSSSATIDKGFKDVYQRLKDAMPHSHRVSIVHNDFKLDNCQFQFDNPDKVTAVFDWDMATLGDPLIDLGNLLGYWQEDDESVVRLPTRQLQIHNLPRRAELVERYIQATGEEVSHIDWNINWYEAFALWRNAAVFRQLASRYARGETTDPGYRDLDASIPAILATAADIALT